VPPVVILFAGGTGIHNKQRSGFMERYDIIIKNARIVDGTGSPWYRGDVGVKDGKIAFMGNMPKDAVSDEVIDAKDQVLSPGFIDIHTHSDFLLLRDPVTESKIKQGVTTQMIGQCGISPAPIKPDKVELLDRYTGFVKAGAEPKYDWQTFGQYLDALDRLDLGCNVAPVSIRPSKVMLKLQR
jgi:N-acyl-D-amino-acid deacylase